MRFGDGNLAFGWPANLEPAARWPLFALSRERERVPSEPSISHKGALIKIMRARHSEYECERECDYECYFECELELDSALERVTMIIREAAIWTF